MAIEITTGRIISKSSPSTGFVNSWMVEFFGKEDGNAAMIEFDVIRKPADGELAERVFPTTFNVDLFPKKAKASWTNAEILALIEELKSINDVETRLTARLLHVTQAEVVENTTL
jgi:hypothetical protein